MDINIIENKIVNLMSRSEKNGDVPVGCVIFKTSTGEIVSTGYNKRDKSFKISQHAEIVAMDALGQKNGSWNLSGYSIVVNIEPCMMCLGAIIQSKIDKIYYYEDSKKTGFVNSNHTFDISKMPVQKMRTELNNFIKKKINSFFKKLR